MPVTMFPRGRLLPEQFWKGRHRGLSALLWAHVPALFVFGLFRGVPVGHALALVGLIAVPGVVAGLARLAPAVRSMSTSVGLMLAASVLVHLWDGTIEAHFHYFVVLAFLTLYQVWGPFLAAQVVVVLEHGLIGTVAPDAVYNHADAAHHPWRWAAVHAGFVLAAGTAGLLSWAVTERAAHRDLVTGLPNRSFALMHAQAVLDRRGVGPCGVVMLKLADFADVNAAFGHDAGDEVLRQVAQRLTDVVRPADTVVRLGGDEFGVVVTGDTPRCLAIAAAALTVCDDAFPLGVATIRLTGRVGVSVATPDVEVATILLREAELAVRQARSSSAARPVAFEPAMLLATTERIALVGDLRHALDNGGLALHYQPSVDAHSLHVVGGGGAAALAAPATWPDPTASRGDAR